MAYKITDDTNYSDIADAIRAKLGSSDSYRPTEMAGAIEAIPTSSMTIDEDDTLFIDYDGSVVYAFSQDEIAEMTELPALPSHVGLDAEEWNWSLEDLQAFGRKAIVGANYMTNDEKTRIYFKISESLKTVSLGFNQSVANAVVVDWGDGSQTETSADSYVALEHVYEEAGEYMITLDVTNGVMKIFGTLDTGSALLCHVISDGYIDGGTIGVSRIELGKNVMLSSYSIRKLDKLETITISKTTTFEYESFYEAIRLRCVVLPKGLTSLYDQLFLGGLSLKYVSFPASITSIGQSAFTDCMSLYEITIPDNVATVGTYSFSGCASLEEVVLPNKLKKYSDGIFRSCTLLKNIVFGNAVTSLGKYCFQDCKLLKLIDIPDTVTTISGSAFNGCVGVEDLVIPSGVTTINEQLCRNNASLRSITFLGDIQSFSGTNSFQGDELIQCYDLSHCTVVPVLKYTSGIYVTAETVIKVPASLYNDFLADTKWSGFGANIVAV